MGWECSRGKGLSCGRQGCNGIVMGAVSGCGDDWELIGVVRLVEGSWGVGRHRLRLREATSKRNLNYTSI